MKISVSVSLDADVATELGKEKDKNALVNSYLRNYFGLSIKSQTAIKQEELDKEMEKCF